MASVHTIPLHLGDLITDTVHLSAAELGAYMRLLSFHYRAGRGGIPDDDVQLRRITGLDNKTWRSSRDTILSFFEQDGDRRWVHRRVQKTLDGIAAVQEQNRAKALKRWNTPDATALPEQCSGSAAAMQSKSQKPKARRGSGTDVPSPPPTSSPDWLPVPEWEAFKEMRKKLKAPLGDYAEQLALRDLTKLREQGQDPKAVIDQSIFRSWKGLFPVKTDPPKGTTHGKHTGFAKQDYFAGTDGFEVVGGPGAAA